ncbi:MAG: hypothetical protein EZS28_002884 [Streblomastix strix]|uniref:SPRY domain-containing protein n=1 Tax=Streblomastix strix TaxID=222440 RepID=A0A5J4X305_9EUKA|nr:MAG: hypothetical protein EZS28_002884 [Streblomastix strix]
MQQQKPDHHHKSSSKGRGHAAQIQLGNDLKIELAKYAMRLRISEISDFDKIEILCEILKVNVNFVVREWNEIMQICGIIEAVSQLLLDTLNPRIRSLCGTVMLQIQQIGTESCDDIDWPSLYNPLVTLLFNQDQKISEQSKQSLQKAIDKKSVTIPSLIELNIYDRAARAIDQAFPNNAQQQSSNSQPAFSLDVLSNVLEIVQKMLSSDQNSLFKTKKLKTSSMRVWQLNPPRQIRGVIGSILLILNDENINIDGNDTDQISQLQIAEERANKLEQKLKECKDKIASVHEWAQNEQKQKMDAQNHILLLEQKNMNIERLREREKKRADFNEQRLRMIQSEYQNNTNEKNNNNSESAASLKCCRNSQDLSYLNDMATPVDEQGIQNQLQQSKSFGALPLTQLKSNIQLPLSQQSSKSSVQLPLSQSKSKAQIPLSQTRSVTQVVPIEGINNDKQSDQFAYATATANTPIFILPPRIAGFVEGNKFIHTNDTDKYCTVAVDPVVQDGYVRFDVVFDRNGRFGFCMGIASAQCTFSANNGPWEAGNDSKTIRFWNCGKLEHLTNGLSGNTEFRDNQRVSAEVDMVSNPHKVAFYVNNEEQPNFVIGIPAAIRFWVRAIYVAASTARLHFSKCPDYLVSHNPQQETQLDLKLFTGEEGGAESDSQQMNLEMLFNPLKISQSLYSSVPPAVLIYIISALPYPTLVSSDQSYSSPYD